MNEKHKKALELFHNGCNCAQSTFASYAEEMGLSESEAKRFMEAFGGGVGASHEEICGGLSGACAVIGYMNSDGSETAQTKQDTYKEIREIMKQFDEELGHRRCGPILKENAKLGRTCDAVVIKGVDLIEDYINKK